MLGIRNRRYVHNEMKKLCPKCLNKMVARNNSIIKRVDSFERKTFSCDFCGKDGNRYFVIPKQNHEKDMSSMRLGNKPSNQSNAGGVTNE